MRKLNVLICLGLLAAFTAQANAAVTHVSGGVITTLTGAITAAAAGDTIVIDDSTTYTATGTIQLDKQLTIMAAPNQYPVIAYAGTSSNYAIQINVGGCQFGSLNGGTITVDLMNAARRGIMINSDGVRAVFGAGNTTTTLENLVIRRFGTSLATSTSVYGIFAGQDDNTESHLLPAGAVINLRNIDFQFNPGMPALAPNVLGAGSLYIAMRLHPAHGSVFNVENVRCNSLVGYALTCGFEGGRTWTCGTVNVKNCRFAFDAASDHPRQGSPIATMGWNPNLDPRGMTLNIDNSYLRSDSTKSGYLNNVTFVRASDTSNSLGVISLLTKAQNNLNMTNTAIVGTGAGINVDTTTSLIQMTNCDIYVNAAAQVTPGYFVNISPRAVVAAGVHNATATRCNLYGLQGSQIAAATRTGTYTMNTCNDWSPAGAYASNWVTNSCVTPGQDPGYGSVANRNFTVSNAAISSQNIGANRTYSAEVPVELSTFELR